MAETSVEEAKDMVKKYVADSLSEYTTLNIYMVPEDLSQIEFYYRPSFDIPSSVYTFYIDPTPEADLVHKVRVVFISKETGKFGTLYSGMPLKNVSNWELINSPKIDINDASLHGEHTIEGIYFDSRGLVQYDVFAEATNAVEKNSNVNSYAVIISGGINIDENHIRYWNYWEQGFYGPTIIFDANFDGLLTKSSNVNSNDIAIYPNPTTGDLTISLGVKSAIVTISDMIGNVVFSKTTSGELFVDISSYNKGIYLVKIVTENDSYTEKVVLK